MQRREECAEEGGVCGGGRRVSDLHVESCRDHQRPLWSTHCNYGHGRPVTNGNHQVDDAQAGWTQQTRQPTLYYQWPSPYLI